MDKLKILDTKVAAVGAIALVGVLGIWYVKKQVGAVVEAAAGTVDAFVNGTPEQQARKEEERKLLEKIGWFY